MFRMLGAESRCVMSSNRAPTYMKDTPFRPRSAGEKREIRRFPVHSRSIGRERPHMTAQGGPCGDLLASRR
jgi:hypothetical protein